jgi:hypothetical protein
VSRSLLTPSGGAHITEQKFKVVGRQPSTPQEHCSHLLNRRPCLLLREHAVGAAQGTLKAGNDGVSTSGLCEQFERDGEVARPAAIYKTGEDMVDRAGPMASMELRHAKVSGVTCESDQDICSGRVLLVPSRPHVGVAARAAAEHHSFDLPPDPCGHNRMGRFVSSAYFEERLIAHDGHLAFGFARLIAAMRR